jgi:hypothetical protein
LIKRTAQGELNPGAAADTPVFCRFIDALKQSRIEAHHDRVVEYLSNLNLEDYIGSHDSRDVVVLADSGYDNKHIEKRL